MDPVFKDFLLDTCYNPHRSSLYLFLESSVKQFDEQILLPVVLGIVEHRQDDILHEPVSLVLGHLKDELGKVCGVGL